MFRMTDANAYYVDYPKNNDFSGNVGSVFHDCKDITESILSRNDEFRYGSSLESRFNTDNRIVIKTIINLMDKKGKCEIITSKKYISDLLNGYTKPRVNKDLVKEAKEIYERTGSTIRWEN